MESYNVLIMASAAGELERLPKKDLRRVVNRIRSLSVEPRPGGCEKLSARERYRLRQEDYRIVYSIDDAVREVVIVMIGPRREVYRR